MTIYSEVKSKYLEDGLEAALIKVDEVSEDINALVQPADLGDFTRFFKVLDATKGRVSGIKLTYSEEELKAAMQEVYAPLLMDDAKERDAINAKYEAAIEEIKQRKINEAKEANDAAIKDFEENNGVYQRLEAKRQQLMKYSDKVMDLCSSYGILSSDIAVANDTFSNDELDKLYDEYINYMESSEEKKGFVAKFRSEANNVGFQALALGVFAFLCFTPVLSLIAIAFFGVIIKRQLGVQEKVKNYTILMGILFNIKPLESNKVMATPEGIVPEEIDEEADEDIDALAEEWATELDGIEVSSIQNDYDKDLISLANEYGVLQEEFASNIRMLESEKELLMEKINQIKDSAEKDFEDRKSKIQLLGSSVQSSQVFNSNFRIGLKDGVIEETVRVGLQNITFIQSPDKDSQSKFLQVMLVNAFTNVKMGKLLVHVYDPNSLGQELVGLYREDYDRLFQFHQARIDELITSLQEYATNNMKTMRTENINSFNASAEEVGRTTVEYRLLIVMSQPKKVSEDEALREFMKYSANMGVFVWVIADKPFEGTYVFNKPFAGAEHPYPIGHDFLDKAADTLVDAMKNSKSASLAYTDFVASACPDEKEWTYSADNYVDFNPGFRDGDPTQYRSFTLGNAGDIHAIGVGTTGAGKSVFINNLIAVMTKKYSPSTLELWLVDYKGNEFTSYLPTAEKPYMLPHIAACLCTSDGDYAASLMKALFNEMQRRYDLLGDIKNIGEYNEKMRNAGTPEKQLKRIICINDEFQVIFKTADPTLLDAIKRDIGQIVSKGRAAGVHLFFTSQSMNKTLDAEMLKQFTLKFVLRCDKDVSSEVLGSPEAGFILEPNGYLYVKSQSDQTPARYRTPYITPGNLDSHVKHMYERASSEGLLRDRVISYVEADTYQTTDIEELYDAHQPGAFNNAFFFGMPMVYKDNKAPENYRLEAVNNAHIYSVFPDQEDYVNFYRTIMTNIKKHTNDPLVFLNSQVRDLHYLCELDKDCPEDLLPFSTEKTSCADLVMMFQQMFDARVASGNKEQPAYIVLLGWDKGVGFGVDKNTVLTSQFQSIIQLCGEYNMHFIFINSSQGQTPTTLVNACSVRICGRCGETESYAVLETKQGCKVFEKIKNGYMYVNIKREVSRAKIYRSKQDREVKKSTVSL